MTNLIDMHRHHWAFDWFPPSHLKEFNWQRAVRTNRTIDEVLERAKQSPVFDSSGEWMLNEMERYNIDFSVILCNDMGLGYGPNEDNQVPIEEIHKKTAEVCDANANKLAWFCGVDPRRPRSVKFFEECVKNMGAIGLKVYPPHGYQANDPICFPMYEKAIELDVPVLIHTGGNIWAWPEWVELVARKYPELRIMLGHVNLQAPFETGAYWRGLQAAYGKSNVWLDICDWQVLNAVNEENLEALLKVLRVFFDSMGPERIVWGTDLPMVGSEAVNNTLTWSDIARNLPEWGNKYNINFTNEERDGLCEGAGKAVLSNFDFNFLD